MRGFNKLPLFVDSNIFLRTLVIEDEKIFQECIDFFKILKRKNKKFYTSTLVLVEINFVLRRVYKFKKGKTVKALESISQFSNLQFLDIFNQNMALALHKSTNVKFTDCLIASLVREKMIIVSYDKDFDKLGVKRMEPGDFLKIRQEKILSRVPLSS